MKDTYYAVIFTSTRTAGDKGYAEKAGQKEKLGRRHKVFLGFESARVVIGVSVSYLA